MLELVQRLDFWLMIGAIVFAIWLEIDKVRAWWKRRAGDRPVKYSQASGSSVMSRPLAGHSPDRAVAPPVAQTVQQPRQPIATANNAINSELHPAAELSDEVRDIIQFQDRVDIVVSLYKSGQVTNLAKAIESVFKCSRTSKEESTYQRAKRAIDPLIAKPTAPTPIAGRPTSAVFQSDLEEAL